MKVYFHMQSQFLDLNGRMGHSFHVGDVCDTQITYFDYHQISREMSEGVVTCSESHYDDCIYRMLEREMVSNTVDNCTVPWVPNNAKICSSQKDINTTFWIAWDRITNTKKASTA